MIQITMRLEKSYPQFNPQQKLLLENQRAYDYRNSFIRYGSNAHFLPTKFSHLLVKELTEADVTTRSLKLGWLGFYQAVFPAERTEFIVVDYLGYTWKVLMDFCHDEGVSCIFYGQWQALVSARRLTKGQIIRLGVTGESNNDVKYLCARTLHYLTLECMENLYS